MIIQIVNFSIPRASNQVVGSSNLSGRTSEPGRLYSGAAGGVRRFQSNSRQTTRRVRRQRRAAAMAGARRGSRASARPRGRRPRSNPSGRTAYILGPIRRESALVVTGINGS